MSVMNYHGKTGLKRDEIKVLIMETDSVEHFIMQQLTDFAWRRMNLLWKKNSRISMAMRFDESRSFLFFFAYNCALDNGDRVENEIADYLIKQDLEIIDSLYGQNHSYMTMHYPSNNLVSTCLRRGEKTTKLGLNEIRVVKLGQKAINELLIETLPEFARTILNLPKTRTEYNKLHYYMEFNDTWKEVILLVCHYDWTYYIATHNIIEEIRPFFQHSSYFKDKLKIIRYSLSGKGTVSVG